MASTVLGPAISAALCLSLGAVFLRLSLSRGARPYVDAPRSLRAWRRLLVQPTSAARITSTHLLGYTAIVPTETAWFRQGVGVYLGRAMRVHVPIDHVARLTFEDGWGNGRILDSSAFCFDRSGGSDEIEFLARSARRQLVFAEADGLTSSDGYPLQCHLAVHLEMNCDANQSAAWDWLFDNALTLEDRLRRDVSGHLRSAFVERQYRQTMYEGDKILVMLNEVAANGGLLTDSRPELRLRFTGLVIKPRERAERNLLVAAAGNHEVLKERTAAITEDIAHERGRWLARWTELFRRLELSLHALHGEVEQAITAASNGLRGAIPDMNTESQVIESVRSVFETGQGQFERSSRQVLQGFNDLHEFIADLNAENRALQEAMVVAHAPAPTPSVKPAS